MEAEACHGIAINTNHDLNSIFCKFAVHATPETKSEFSFTHYPLAPLGECHFAQTAKKYDGINTAHKLCHSTPNAIFTPHG